MQTSLVLLAKRKTDETMDEPNEQLPMQTQPAEEESQVQTPPMNQGEDEKSFVLGYN